MSSVSSCTISYEEIAAKLPDREAAEKEISELNQSFAELSVRDLMEESADSAYSSNFLAGYLSNAKEE